MQPVSALKAGVPCALQVTCSVPWRRVPVLIYFVPAGATAPIDIIPVAFTGDTSTPEWFQRFSTGNCTLLLQDPQVGPRQHTSQA
jgi:hypothetical protein